MLVSLTESRDENTVAVIGDIHGQYEKLETVLEEIEGTGMTVVFCGDYIDRGPRGIDVLSKVMEMNLHPQTFGLSKVVALLGNHEQMAIDAVADVEKKAWKGKNVNLWLHNGGRMEEFPAIKNDYIGWLRALPTYYKHPKKVKYKGEEKDLLVTHGCVDPTVSLESQSKEILTWGRAPMGWDSQTVVVNGHTPCEYGEPEVYETATGTCIRIDTGAAYDGPLTALLMEEVQG